MGIWSEAEDIPAMLALSLSLIRLAVPQEKFSGGVPHSLVEYQKQKKSQICFAIGFRD
jgi:hypothetical protein